MKLNMNNKPDQAKARLGKARQPNQTLLTIIIYYAFKYLQ